MARGIFISYFCDIYDSENIIGKAEVEKTGLYYRIQCSCKLPKEQVFRIFTETSTGVYNLGVCIPNGDVATIVTNIPIRRLGSEPRKFYTVCGTNKGCDYYESSETTPFLHLDELRNFGYFQINGKSCLKRLKSKNVFTEENP